MDIWTTLISVINLIFGILGAATFGSFVIVLYSLLIDKIDEKIDKEVKWYESK